MKVIAPRDVYLPAVGDNVEQGQEVEVDDETGASLVAQGWQRAGARSSKPRKQRAPKASEPSATEVHAEVASASADAPTGPDVEPDLGGQD